MNYTEKVSISGTAVSFLLYECLNSPSSQEGFLIGEVTSEVTKHISDLQSDNARLDTLINVRAVLPLPLLSLYYSPTGRIKEDVLSDLLSDHSSEVVGWYKYRKNSSIKPTFRDKRICKNLQNYFKKCHAKGTFVTCHVSSRLSSSGSTHTSVYRFGKVNCLGVYEYIEDYTANLGEKCMGYKKGVQSPPDSIFDKIVQEISASGDDSTEAIIKIQEALDRKLVKEAQIAADTECSIRKLEAEIQEMIHTLSDRQTAELQDTYDKMIEDKQKDQVQKMVQGCLESLETDLSNDIMDDPGSFMIENDGERNNHILESPESLTSPESHRKSPVFVVNYAGAVKKELKPTDVDKPSTSTS